MRIKHTSSRGRMGRSARLLAVAVGMVVTAAFAMPTTAAASPQGYSASQLSAVSAAVLIHRPHPTRQLIPEEDDPLTSQEHGGERFRQVPPGKREEQEEDAGNDEDRRAGGNGRPVLSALTDDRWNDVVAQCE